MTFNGHAAAVQSMLRRPVVALLAGVCLHASQAAGEDAIDCASINLGRLDVALASDSSTVRTVAMQAGDTLTFTFRADTRARGAIMLVAGDGREQRLLYGPHAAQVSYTAELSGPVRFRLAMRGGKIATFITTCSPAEGAPATVAGGLTVDMSVPLVLGATAPKDAAVTLGAVAAVPTASTLRWLGGAQSGKETTPADYGVNLKLQPTLTVGLVAQFDQASNPLLGPTALSEQRWQAGPVMNVLLGQGLSLDAHAAWGPADPITGQTLNRQTFDARLTSRQQAGPWRFTPSLSYAHVEAKLGTAGSEIPGQQTVESGRLDVRPELAYRFDLGGSMYMEPKFMVGTFWNLGDAAATGQHDPRAMAETAITFGTGEGTQLQLGGGVQEGETRADSVWTGKVQLSIPLK